MRIWRMTKRRRTKLKGLIIGLIVFCVFLVVFQSHVVQDIVLFIIQEKIKKNSERWKRKT